MSHQAQECLKEKQGVQGGFVYKTSAARTRIKPEEMGPKKRGEIMYIPQVSGCAVKARVIPVLSTQKTPRSGRAGGLSAQVSFGTVNCIISSAMSIGGPNAPTLCRRELTADSCKLGDSQLIMFGPSGATGSAPGQPQIGSSQAARGRGQSRQNSLFSGPCPIDPPEVAWSMINNCYHALLLPRPGTLPVLQPTHQEEERAAYARKALHPEATGLAAARPEAETALASRDVTVRFVTYFREAYQPPSK